jgi:uncharacterized protein (TIGR03435 family)
MIPSQLIPFAHHLWQSTLFAGVAGLLTLFLRKQRAHVRYWLWLMASVKFLFPFSILVAAGGLLGRHTTATGVPTGLVSAADFSSFVEHIGRPFTTTVPRLAMPSAQSSYASMIVAVLGIVWATGFVTLVCLWTLRWRRMRASVRKASPLYLPIGLPVRSSPAFGEPGVFGIFRPVLLLPDKILDCLTAREMESIVAHELCHVRRRDNLATLIHMAVEVVFWFHPLVWWLGARLIDERERACDEEVLRTVGEPRIYAEGILKVCELYLASPLACVAGVTGGDLKRRIEAIIGNQVVCRLNYAKKAMLTVAVMAAVAGPIAIGILHPPQSRAQTRADDVTFEVASVKPADPNSNRGGMSYNPDGGLNFINVTLKQLIANAYNIVCGKVCDDRISGGPGWIDSARFDVLTKGPQLPAPGRATAEQIRQASQALLSERFKLVVRRETREMPVYHLVVAKNGHKLKEYTGDNPQGGIRGNRPGEMIGERSSLRGLVRNLTGMAGRPVIDRTGLTGRYDFKLEWTPDMPAGGKGPDFPGEKAPSDAIVSVVPDIGCTIWRCAPGSRTPCRRGICELVGPFADDSISLHKLSCVLPFIGKGGFLGNREQRSRKLA